MGTDFMKIVQGFPPNFNALKSVFPSIENNKGIIFTYGYVIYNPYNRNIDIPLLFHEATHSLQQDELGIEQWWTKYLEDTDFRINQEAEAYHQQFNKYRTIEKDRNKHTQFLHTLAQDLASEIYGNVITHSEALKAINNYGKDKLA